jgi:addiction module HigA family antidote
MKVHPGKVLRKELERLKITPEQLATGIKVSPNVIKELIEEKRNMDKDLATRLSVYFKTTVEFWLNT